MKKLILSATIFLILILSLFYYKGAYIGELQDSQQVLGGKYLIKKYTTKSLLQYLPSMGTSSDKVNGYVRVFDSKEESIIFEKYVKNFYLTEIYVTDEGIYSMGATEFSWDFPK